MKAGWSVHPLGMSQMRPTWRFRLKSPEGVVLPIVEVDEMAGAWDRYTIAKAVEAAIEAYERERDAK